MGQVKLIGHPELRRREQGSRTSKGRKTINRKVRKSKCWVNKCLLGHRERMKLERNFTNHTLSSSLSITSSSYDTVVICGDSSVSGVLHLNYFWKLGKML